MKRAIERLTPIPDMSASGSGEVAAAQHTLAMIKYLVGLSDAGTPDAPRKDLGPDAAALAAASSLRIPPLNALRQIIYILDDCAFCRCTTDHVT
jgi:hypothetical protein